jgi:signal peptidase I
MKRGIGLGLVIIACILGFLTIKGALPFMPNFGTSMEPALQSGSLLTIKSLKPADVKVGDIIVFNVPKSVRDYYNYPPVVSHRVIEVKTVPSLCFRTRGDNTCEDPFTILPADIRGTVGTQIPYLGLPLLYFQSLQGIIFIIIALLLLAIILYGGDLLRGATFLRRGIFAPVINEEKRANRVLTHKIEATEKKIDSTEQALGNFTTAIADYAQHLANHTSAVQSLAEASQELKKSAAEQNRVLMSFVQTMGKTPLAPEPPAAVKPAPVAPVKPQKTIEEITRQLIAQKPAGVIKPQPQPQKPPEAKRPVALPQKPAANKIDSYHKALKKPLSITSPGCVRNREELTKEALAAEQEIFSALDRLHKKLEKPNR